MVALESAGAIDPSYDETFDRLSRLYAARKMQPELANLLERRLEGVSDPEERLVMEVRRGRILLEVGDVDGARSAFEAALAQRPDDANALSAFADLCVAQQDWDAAEQALVRLARLLPTPEEQRGRLRPPGRALLEDLLNLSRAEVAFKEVLKRAPDDAATIEKLVDVYKRQNDPRAPIELQQELFEVEDARGEAHAPRRPGAHPRAHRARQPQGRADARGRASRVPAGRRGPARPGRLLHAAPADARGQHPARPGRLGREACAGQRPLLAAAVRDAGHRLRSAGQEGRGARHPGRCSPRSRAGPESCAAPRSARSIPGSTT